MLTHHNPPTINILQMQLKIPINWTGCIWKLTPADNFSHFSKRLLSWQVPKSSCDQSVVLQNNSAETWLLLIVPWFEKKWKTCEKHFMDCKQISVTGSGIWRDGMILSKIGVNLNSFQGGHDSLNQGHLINTETLFFYAIIIVLNSPSFSVDE